MNRDAHRLAYRVTAILIVITALGASTGLLRAAGVYKSVDAQGHVVYSDHPDMSVPQTRVEIVASNSYSSLEAQSNEPPPPLPDSEQPPCPEDGYLWTPGYWAWSDGGYYWIVGDWVAPPRIGLLWTPGFWEYIDDVYLFHPGYWASDVGYYGGIDYGFGYSGVGYAGGRWVGSTFAYNRTVSNIGARAFRNVYSEPVNQNPDHNRMSYNGGPGGTKLAPTAQERARLAESHISPTILQRRSMAEAAKAPAIVRQAFAAPKPYVPHEPPPAAARNYIGPPAATQRENVRARPSNAVTTQPAVTHPKVSPTRSATPSRGSVPLQPTR
jgi:hypothetical protein